MAIGGTVLFVQGDDLPTITLSLRDRNTPAPGRVLDPSDSDTWAPLQLEGATIKADVRAKGGTEIVDVISAEIIDRPTARIRLLIPTGASFTAASGDYEVELTITYDYGSQQTVYDWLLFKVRARFA